MNLRKHELNTMGVEVVGWGHYLPKRVVTTEEIREKITLKASSIDQKVIGDGTGVISRHRADEDETVAYMSKMSIGRALEEARVEGSNVDLLILVNWTDKIYIPEAAPMIATEIGANHAIGFDLSTGCCGFTTATMTAAMYLLGHPRVNTAVVVCTEIFSKRVRPGSTGELIVGDGSVAFVLKRSDSEESGIIDFDLGNEGKLRDLITVKMPEGWIKSKPELANVAAGLNKRAIDDILERNNITAEDIDWFIPHPGTQIVHETIKEYIQLPDDKFVVNFERVANLSSASIPMVISESLKSGKFSKGDLCLCPAIGSGMYYGATLIRL